jgi:hypothetical protein
MHTRSVQEGQRLKIVILARMRLSLRVIVICVFVCASAVLTAAEQSAETSKKHAACGEVEDAPSREKPAVVYGTAYVIPNLRLRILDTRTGVVASAREVIVRYVWRWFEYPYQEHPLGVWSDAYVLRKCATDEQGFVEVSEFTVTPRGWYKGKLLLWRKPVFTHLDVSVHLEKHISHVRIDKSEIERYRKSRADVITLRVPFTSSLSQ